MTANGERRTANGERRTANDERRKASTSTIVALCPEPQTPNSELQTLNHTPPPLPIDSGFGPDGKCPHFPGPHPIL